MEPNDLKSPPPDDAALETWLRANAALPPLPDGDFSRRVLSALPPPKRGLSLRHRFTLAGALAGVAAAAWPFFTSGNPLDRLPALDEALVNVVSQLTSPTASLALAATAGSLLFVFWRDLRRFVRM